MNREKRIALFVPSLRGGGAERMMVNLANSFASRGIPTDLVLVRAVGPYRDEVSPDVNILDLDATRILTSAPGLVRYLRAYRPDALLSTMTFANIVSTWACAWVRSPPRLVLREANTVSAISKNNRQLKYWLIPYLIRFFYPWADKIITISEGSRSDFVRESNMSIEKVEKIYNPVVSDELIKKARVPPDHPWLSEDKRPVILGVGRLEPQKDFQTLLRAFRKVRNEKELRLIILGEGEQREELESLVQCLSLSGDVEMPGFVSNPFSYMANSDLFVLSSKFEGLGNVLIEAMATGCPVVSTDCPNGPSEILEGGRWGRLVPVGDEKELAAAILESLGESHSPDALQSRAQAFSTSSVSEQYLDVLLG